MLVDQESEFWKYIEQHPGRTILVGKLLGEIKVRMEDGREIIVPSLELLPE
jgi:hypothetical protein